MERMTSIDEVMYSCGLDILHPGGIEKTDEMARLCKIGDGKRVLDIGSGKGVTACYLAEKYKCKVIGIDSSEKMVKYAKKMAKEEGLYNKVSFIKGNAHKLPFKEESFDILLAECTTVLLDKERAFSEFIRVLKYGGYLGDLEMTWKKFPPQELINIVYELWEGFKTMTLDEWKNFYRKMGLIDIKTKDFSEKISDMEKTVMKELGFKGIIKMVFNLVLHPSLGKTMYEYRKIFKEYNNYIGYGYIVGKKE